MRQFIAATPLFDASMAVEAYRLRDQSCDMALAFENDFRSKSEAMQSPGLDLLEQVGIETFAADKPIFVDINRIQLMMGMPLNLGIPADRMACVLPGGLPVEHDLLQRCRALRQNGCALALENFPLNGVNSPYFEYADHLFLNQRDPRFDDIIKVMVNRHPHTRLVIDEVPDQECFDKNRKNRDTRRALFSGDFYNCPLTSGTATITPLKVNALQLRRALSSEDFELSDIGAIIKRDVALTLSLLRFISSNSPNKVGSVQGAVATMGRQTVKRWGASVSMEHAEHRPGEASRLSLIRAKFAENLAGAYELNAFQNHLFIAGLFSLLDIILAKPMVEAIGEVAVDERVRKALVEKGGELYPVLELIYAYERAEWDKVSILMIRNNTDIEAVSTAFVDALIWYNKLLATIDKQEQEAAT